MADRSDSPIAVDGRRFWATVMRSGEIGPGKAGGLRRLALTDADKEMRDLFVTWCTEAGCTVTVDRVGNVFARRPGREDHLPPVLIGSHLDTQVAGGKYDGIVGVLAGLEILRTLDDQRVGTRRPLELVCWTNEEGARFTPPMVASGAFAGVFDVDWVLALRDDDGAVFGDELRRIGYDGKTAVGGRGIDAYFELHIEQGPLLERDAVPVGIVTGGYAVRGMHVDVHGETAHSGPTPMDRRLALASRRPCHGHRLRRRRHVDRDAEGLFAHRVQDDDAGGQIAGVRRARSGAAQPVGPDGRLTADFAGRRVDEPAVIE